MTRDRAADRIADALLGALVFGLVVGFAIGRLTASTSSSAPERPSHPPAVTQERSGPPSDGAEPTASAAPTREPADPTAAWLLDGTASTYGPGWDGWIATPWPRGSMVVICGPGGCAERTTNDVGPDLAMQRAGRVADLDVATFELVCAVRWTMGLCPVTVELVRRG